MGAENGTPVGENRLAIIELWVQLTTKFPVTESVEAYEQKRIALDEVDVTSAELIENQLIPAQQRHIQALDQLIQSVKSA